jgi:hypothetical protein
MKAIPSRAARRRDASAAVDEPADAIARGAVPYARLANALEAERAR